MHCLQRFTSNDKIYDHKEVCIEGNGVQAINIPEEGSNLEFHKYNWQLEAQFATYADFEAFMERSDNEEGLVEINEEGNISYTKETNEHIDCGYGYKVVCRYDDRYSKHVRIFHEDNAVYRFKEQMLKEGI